MQQDAHEFLNFLINHINETIIGAFFCSVKILCFMVKEVNVYFY